MNDMAHSLPLPLAVSEYAAMPMPVCIVQFYLERQNELAVDVYAIIELNSHLLIVSNVVEEHRAHKSTRTHDNRGIFDFKAMCFQRNERHVYFSTALNKWASAFNVISAATAATTKTLSSSSNKCTCIRRRSVCETNEEWGKEHSFTIIILTHYYYYYRLIKC